MASITGKVRSLARKSLKFCKNDAAVWTLFKEIVFNHSLQLFNCIRVLCTYRRPSQEVDPREFPGICTKTFANSTYPGPILFNKKLSLSLPWEPTKEKAAVRESFVLMVLVSRNEFGF